MALSGEFHFGASDVPVFFINATLIGLVWGLLRLGSGSIIVSSAAHGLWNGLTYVLFGVGSGLGALGIRDVSLYGPEVGWIAVALNAAFAAFLIWLFRDRLQCWHRAGGHRGLVQQHVSGPDDLDALLGAQAQRAVGLDALEAPADAFMRAGVDRQLRANRVGAD